MGEIDALNDEEARLCKDLPNPQDISSEDLEELSRRINERLEKAPKDKDLKRAKKKPGR